MFLSEATLPISISPISDESGLGYCLRSISRNGASLHGLRRLLGIDNVGRFTAKHASHLGRIFRQSSQWFESSLPSIEKTKPYQRDCYGHRWFSKNNLRLQAPQVCVPCLHSKGYCRAVWDVSLSTVCVEHQCYLLDFCSKCQKPLRWDRPRVDVGHCGHLLTSDAIKKAPKVLLDFQTLLERKFDLLVNQDSRPVHADELDWSVLTLSGMHAALVGFGCKEKPYEVLHSRIRTGAYRTEEWALFTLRGLERWSRWITSSPLSDELSSLVSDSLLEHMAVWHDSVQDQKFAVALLERIFSKNLKIVFGSRLERLSQLELF